MKRSGVSAILFVGVAFWLLALPGSQAQSSGDSNPSPGTHHPIIYVMPNAVTNPGPGRQFASRGGLFA